MKILVAVDGSKYGRWATEWIGQMPWTLPPDVTALHVVDMASLRSPVLMQPLAVGNEPFIQAEIKRIQDRATQVTADTTTLLAALQLKGKVLTLKGSTAPTILKRAPARNGLIVIGSHGLDALDRFLLGSVSTHVTVHAPCSVLVVRQPVRPIRRLLLATDGSKSSEQALRFLVREIKPERAGMTIEVLVMHVIQFLRYPEVREAARTIVHEYAEKLAQAGFRADEVTQLGHPIEEIMKIADRHKVDLILAGAKGLGAVARFFLGSVSTKLVQHSPCSVLVVR
jgi:nucleotide-binding universal stress UspA family protein